MKEFIFYLLVIHWLYITSKYLQIKKDLHFYKPKYEKVKKQYQELHNKFYEPVFLEINKGAMKIDWKLKDKYKEEN